MPVHRTTQSRAPQKVLYNMGIIICVENGTAINKLCDKKLLLRKAGARDVEYFFCVVSSYYIAFAKKGSFLSKVFC